MRSTWITGMMFPLCSARSWCSMSTSPLSTRTCPYATWSMWRESCRDSSRTRIYTVLCWLGYQHRDLSSFIMEWRPSRKSGYWGFQMPLTKAFGREPLRRPSKKRRGQSVSEETVRRIWFLNKKNIHSAESRNLITSDFLLFVFCKILWMRRYLQTVILQLTYTSVFVA